MWLPDTEYASIARIITVDDESLRIPLIQDAHDHILSGHPGIAQTIRNLDGYHWTGKNGDVEQYVKRCPKCQQFKLRCSRPRGVLHPLSPATYPFERISIDHIMPLPMSNGFDVILVIVDFFTKFKILIPAKTTDKSPISFNITSNTFSPTSGFRQTLSPIEEPLSFQIYQSSLETTLDQDVSIHIISPQTNGQTERANQELEQYIRFYCNYQQDNWFWLLPLAQYVLNARFHSGIQKYSIPCHVWIHTPMECRH